MGEHESGRARVRVVKPLSAAELARVSGLPFWTEDEAAQVLLAQKRSEQSARAFAAQNGFSSSRLYFWRKRLAATCIEAAEAAGPAIERELAEEQDGEPELGPESLKAALVRALGGDSAVERDVQTYVLRAAQGADKTWRVFEVGATESVLLCVVRWAAWLGPNPYSLAELQRTGQALRWHEFSTLSEALAAFRKRMGSGCEVAGKEGVPLLIPVQVREATQACLASAAGPMQRPSQPAVTIQMPSGVSVRILQGADRSLVQTVLETALGVRPS
ncbi:MAG TPA: hypothetical protein PKI03_25880 [Pseudomonadota bacterium]|nr:hypothetical protein [Pseudomonadota bacterium]